MHKFDSSAALVPSGQQTVVIKIGTSSLLRDEKHTLNLVSIAGIVECVRDLRDLGYHVILVSSGAVGVGCQRMGLDERPTVLAQKQALAAVGQLHLMRIYDDQFSTLGLKSAQVLLTLDNLANRSQYINARNTFSELLRYGAVPVVNENDTVAVEQLRFSENDTLSAQVATLVQADWLFLLTDVDALYTANPHTDPSAEPIREVHDMTHLQVDTSVRGTQWGTGGMATKLTAARIATAAGCKMVICNAKNPRAILSIIQGDKNVGTVFHPLSVPLKGRKRWILSVPVKGEVWLNAGACKSLMDRHTSLFSPGIIKVTGNFNGQDAVRLCDEEGLEIGRGLVNYSSTEIDTIKGMSSRRFQDILKYMGPEEICGRGNICLLVEMHDDDHHHHHHSGHHMPHTTTAPAALSSMNGNGDAHVVPSAAAHGAQCQGGSGRGSPREDDHHKARALGRPPLPGHTHSQSHLPSASSSSGSLLGRE